MITSMEHITNKIFVDWFRNEVEIPKQFFRAPMAKKLDDVGGT